MSEVNTEVQDTQDQVQETAVEAPAEVQAPEGDQKADYSFVPAKFMKEDGAPDFEKLAKSYQSLEKRLGAKPNIPAASADDYEFDFGDMEVDAEALATFKEKALGAGFTKDQYNFMMEQYKTNVQAAQANQWDADRTESTLKEAWGKDYDVNLAAAKLAFDEFAPSDVSPNDPILNHPVVLQLLARMGAELGEDTVAGKTGGNAGPAMTEAEVLALQQSAAYWDDPKVHKQVTDWYAKNKR